MLLVKKNKKRDKDSSLEQFFSLLASTKETVVKKITGGVMVGAYFSNMNLDCSECEFADGSFIAIKSAVACINITIPENVNVKFDCINLFTYVKQEYDTDEVVESRPTVYIALKGAFSSVIISKAEKVEEEANEETEAEKAMDSANKAISEVLPGCMIGKWDYNTEVDVGEDAVRVSFTGSTGMGSGLIQRLLSAGTTEHSYECESYRLNEAEFIRTKRKSGTGYCL